jgi:hypothetical protein
MVRLCGLAGAVALPVLVVIGTSLERSAQSSSSVSSEMRANYVEIDGRLG